MMLLKVLKQGLKTFYFLCFLVFFAFFEVRFLTRRLFFNPLPDDLGEGLGELVKRYADDVWLLLFFNKGFIPKK
jgi:hypothetical protein